MAQLPQALANLRRTALQALAARHGLEQQPGWLDFALRRRRLPAALAVLRKVTAAGRIRRLWIRLIGR